MTHSKLLGMICNDVNVFSWILETHNGKPMDMDLDPMVFITQYLLTESITHHAFNPVVMLGRPNNIVGAYLCSIGSIF